MDIYTSRVAPDTHLISIRSGSGSEICCVYAIAGDELAVVETGPAIQVAGIVQGLQQLGFDARSLAKIIVTHVHMDHAGGVGLLARRLPGAQVLAHERGAKHLIDPAKLIASTKQVQGEDFERFHGPIEPVPAERVHDLRDGEVIDLGRGRTLEVLHTRGHAPHHLCLYDRGSRVLFSGEALGHYHPEYDLLTPAAAPPSFDLEATIADIYRLRALPISAVLFSHSGVCKDPARVLQTALRQAEDCGVIVSDALAAGASLTEINARLEEYGARQYAGNGLAKRRLRGAFSQSAEAFVGYFRRRDSSPAD